MPPPLRQFGQAALASALLALACAAAPPDAQPAPASGSCELAPDLRRGELQRVRFDVGEGQRSLLLYVPTSLADAPGRAPALLAFHGFHSNPWYFGHLIDVTAYAERYGMVVGLPFGTSPTFESELCCPVGCDEACCAKGDKLDSLRPCMWNTGRSTSRAPRVSRMDDVAMARAARGHLVAAACADPARVAALGFSMGGMMMHRLACEAADAFSGVAAVSGSMDLLPEDCAPSAPVAWIQFCGTADRGCSRTVNSTFDLFASQRRCDAATLPTYTSATTMCEARSGCNGGAFVERCALLGLGDEVPGHVRRVPWYTPQPATNLDALKYALDRFSTQAAAAAAPPPPPGNAMLLHV